MTQLTWKLVNNNGTFWGPATYDKHSSSLLLMPNRVNMCHMNELGGGSALPY